MEQIKDDLLEICAWSRSDHRPSGEGYQKSCVTMNVKVQPAITTQSVGFNNEEVDGCDEDAQSANCPTGWFGTPIQPKQFVTKSLSKMLLSMYEGDLHGNPTQCSMDTLGGTGSNSSQRNCGLRFPISFQDALDSNGNPRSLVSPVGVKMNVIVDTTSAETRLTPSQVAQALQLVCTQQARDATDANIGQCVEAMSAAVDSDTLKFLSSDGSQSPYPANKLAWAVGDPTTQKEILVRGTNTPWSTSEYSFNNVKCEHDRKFAIELTHQVGYTPDIIDMKREYIEVVVSDDDFFGKVTFADVQGGVGGVGGVVTSLAAQATHSGTKVNWANAPLDYYVKRDRSAFEAGVDAIDNVTPLVGLAENNKNVPLRALDVYVKLSLTNFEDGEYDIQVCNATNDGIVSGCASQSIATIRANQDGHVKISFPEEVGSGPFLPGVSDIKVIRFQQISQAQCKTGQASVMTMNLAYANYAGSSPLTDTIISGCGTRDPIDAASMQLGVDATLTSQIVVATDSPFTVNFAGFKQGDGTQGFEQSKSSPLSWNAGLDGSYISLTETEHSSCASVGTGYQCSPRSFRLSLCRELRPEAASAPSFGRTGESVSTEFFVQIQDADSSYARINDHYEFDCPTPAVLQTIADNLYNQGQTGLNTLTCQKVSTTTDATSGAAIPCSDASVDCSTGGTRLLWTISTAQDAGADMFKCPAAYTENDFENLPYIIFTNRDDSGSVNLSRRPKIVISNDKYSLGGNTMNTCTYAGLTSSVSLRIEDDEVFNVDNSLIDAEKSEHRISFNTPTWDSMEGRLKFSVTAPYFLDGQEKTIVNVGLGSCKRERWVRASDDTYGPNSAPNPLGLMGSCDMLKPFLGDAAALQTASNSDAFSEVFGSKSYQPTQSQYDDDGFDLFGHGVPAGDNNYLFSALNTNPGGASHKKAWSTSRANISQAYDNTVFHKEGFSAEFSGSM